MAGWLDIEVTKDPDTGAPSVSLTGRARETIKRRNATDVLISLSHTRHYAIAHALLVTGREDHA